MASLQDPVAPLSALN